MHFLVCGALIVIKKMVYTVGESKLQKGEEDVNITVDFLMRPA